MNRHAFSRLCRIIFGRPAIFAPVLTFALSGSAVATGDGNQVAPEDAKRLVAEALRAEVAGDNARRTELLAEAMRAAPDYDLARWHSGQLQTDGGWQTVQDAQKDAAAYPRRTEYNLLRQSNSDSLTGQLALARWCRKNGLVEEANFHWRTVLSHQPNNDEALRALGVRWYGGRLMTFAEVDAEKKRQREARRAAKEFEPRVAQWQRLLSAGDILSRDQALEEIRSRRDVHAIAAIEDVTLDDNLNTHSKFEQAMQIGLAYIDALSKMPNEAAAHSLVRHALFAEVGSVREAAIDALRNRPLHDFVPLLLSGLAMPIESSFRVVTDSDGSVHYWHSLYREGPTASWSVEGRQSAMQYDLKGPLDVFVDDRIRNKKFVERFSAGTNPALQAEMVAVAAGNARRFTARGSAAEQQVAAINAATDAANSVIFPLLTATTNENLGDNPRAWWDWWQDYNEYGSEGEDPVYERRYADSSHRYYRPPRDASYTISPPPPPPARRYSCFAAGTPVWTITGQRPIESLEIGDLVLAQNVDTGELAYKPVIGRTVRPPGDSMTLSLVGGDSTKEQVRATLGHPLWVAGTGWRMAKELGDGAILHGVDGPVQIAATEEAEKIEAYNLVVADFNTYFVGKIGVLAHDNTPRTPTVAVVPGLVPE